jgi:uncharacterized membrane protein YfcA
VIADPAFYAAAVPAVLLAGIGKATGMGLGTIAVPLMALVVSPAVAAAVMLPILCAMDALGLLAWRGQADRAILATLLPGALLGIAIGALAFSLLDVRWIKALLGIESVLFALHQLLARQRLAQRPGAAASAWRGGFWGAVSGFTSTIAHAGSPPLMQYLLPLKLDKERLVATTVIFFTVINAVKLVPYGLIGLIDGSGLVTSLALAPVIPLGYGAGLWLVRRLSPAAFHALIVGSLLLIGVKLLWDAAAG